MAAFCTKCGAALNADTPFCSKCGAPVAAAAPAPAPAQYQPVATPPYQQVSSTPSQPAGGAYYPPAPPPAGPQKSGGGALKIILIVVGVFVLLAILVVAGISFTVWRVAHSIHVESKDNNGQVTLHTGGGTITANSEKSYTAEDLGVPIYPGAVAGKGSMKMDLPTGSMVTGIFVTSDSKDQVLAFYKDKLGSEASTFDSTDGAVIQKTKNKQDQVIVTITANSSQNEGKTQIAIVHTKSNQS